MAANKTSSFNERIHRREGIIVVDYSPKTVGAYRIRPDVSEHEMIAPNKIPSFNGHPRCRERAYAIRPYIFTICSLVIRSLSVSFCFDLRLYL